VSRRRTCVLPLWRLKHYHHRHPWMVVLLVLDCWRGQFLLSSVVAVVQS
jgi:hypothetical protein